MLTRHRNPGHADRCRLAHGAFRR